MIFMLCYVYFVIVNKTNMSYRKMKQTWCDSATWLHPFFFRYKSFIPVSVSQSISQRNLLTRLRISNVFKVFLEEFNNNTVLNSSVNKHDLKVKYISTLETLLRHFGYEVYQPASVSIHESDELLPKGSADEDGAQRRVLVSGTAGVKWQNMTPEVKL